MSVTNSIRYRNYLSSINRIVLQWHGPLNVTKAKTMLNFTFRKYDAPHSYCKLCKLIC